MSKLYELTEAYARLAEAEDEYIDPNTGEVTSPFEQALKELGGAIEHKVESCAKLIKQFDADMQSLKDEEARLAKRRKSLEGNGKRLRVYVRECLEQAQIKRVKTPLFTVYLSPGKPKVDVFNEDLVPDDLRSEPKRPPPDKAAIKSRLDAGQDVPGARLVTGSASLTIR